MVLDFVVGLLYIGIVWCLGQWTVGYLFGEDREKNAYLLAFPLGFSELTLLSTFLYFTGRFPVQAIRVVWLLLGCASLIAIFRRSLVKREALMVFIVVLGLWLVMLIPGIIGGDQYYVYRGNCTDQQTYVEETVAMSMHPIGWYESRTREEIEAVSDVLCIVDKGVASGKELVVIVEHKASPKPMWLEGLCKRRRKDPRQNHKENAHVSQGKLSRARTQRQSTERQSPH